MISFLNKVEENCRILSDRLALALDYDEEALTYNQLWENSGKIYAFLKGKGLKSEDFVLIKLPRGPKIAVAAIGAWRAGVAITIVEDTYQEERIRWIRENCGACLDIDNALYDEIMDEKPLSGFKEVENTDACFAIYTSGTTGRPKGVLHEYGKLDLIMDSAALDVDVKTHHERMGFVAPLNFVAFIMSLITSLCMGRTMYILSYAIVKNLNQYMKFIETQKINVAFMTPSMIRICNSFPDCLDNIMTGSEPANGLYFDKPQIINKYGMSESGYIVAEFCIDRAYDKAPVGKSPLGNKIYILDDEGNEVEARQVGEICFENLYTRGYIDLPEQTKKAFYNNLYHTGDLGYMDENGNLIISGRKDDMIKINGNRIEPAEIEAAATRVLGTKNVVAKGFDENGHAYIVLYALKSDIGDNFDDENSYAVREQLKKELPQYMIPSYFVALDEMPLNANGKVSRKLLKSPSVEIVARDYVAPSTLMEEKLCDAMSSVLGLERVSVKDNFFELGGDSLKAITLVTQCEEMGITSQLLYEYPTVELLAGACEKRTKDATSNRLDGFEKMKKEILPMFREDKEKFESTGVMPSYYASIFYQSDEALKNPDLNPCLVIKLDAMVDEARLRESLVKAGKVCPYVTYSIEIEKQSVPPVLFKKTNTDLQPFELDQIKEFGTSENGGHYVIVSYRDDTIRIQVCHLLTDGYGINKFVDVLLNTYLGKNQEIQCITEKDDYVADLMSRKLPLSDGYESTNYYVKDHFLIPEAVGTSGKSFTQSFCVDFEQVRNFCGRNRISMQACAALFMSLAIMKANPENERVISVRGPVDTRRLLGVPNTFQNASAPHLFFNVDANKIKEGAISEICASLMSDMENQLTYDNMAAFTNRLAQFNFANNAEEKKRIAISYKSQTDIFANYLGESLISDESEHILSVSNKMGASYPLMLYIAKSGDKAKFMFISSFEADSYVKAMKIVLSENQIQ